MKAGDLRHRVTIQTATETTDAYGQPVQTWGTTGVRFARVEPMEGREQFHGQGVRTDVTHRVTMRKDPALTIRGKQRLLFEGRTLNVEWAKDLDERGRELVIYATERVS